VLSFYLVYIIIGLPSETSATMESPRASFQHNTPQQTTANPLLDKASRQLKVLHTTLWDMRARWEHLAYELGIPPGTIEVRFGQFLLCLSLLILGYQ